MKKLFLLAFVAMVSLVHCTYAQTPCKGSAGSMTLTASNLITSPSVVTLAFTHFGAASGWGAWQNQLSYKLSSNTTYVNCASSVSGLIPGAKYDFRVSATRFCLRDGFTTQSQIVGAFVTNFQLKPITPTALPANGIGIDSFIARWNKNGGVADHYFVEVALDQAFNSIVLSNLDAGSDEALIVRGLMPGTHYYYRVLASTPVGNSSYSNVSEFTTLVSPPTMLPATNIGTTSFTANWQTIGVVTHSFLKVLEVTVQPDLGEIVLDVDAGTSTSFNVTGLKPNTKYFYFVRVTNDLTTSPFFIRSDAVFTLTDNPPASPTALAATYYGTDGITAHWQSTGPVDHFNLYFSTDSIDFSPNKLVFPNPLNVGTSDSANVRPFAPNVPYFYRISAVNSAGATSYSNTSPRFLIQRDTVPPATPTGLSVSLGIIRTITWSPNTETDLAFYKVYILSNLDSTIIANVIAPQSTFTQTNINQAATYRYGISAVDLSGNESAVSAFLIIPPSSLPALQSNTATEEGVKIFPNPTNSLLFVELPNAGDATIEIRDLSGSPVRQDHYNQSAITLDLSTIRKGTYIMNIQQGKSLRTERILIK